MSELKQRTINTILEVEGGYVNDQDDSGGETYRGISRKHHPEWAGWKTVDAAKSRIDFPECLDGMPFLRDMTWLFYEQKYWNSMRLDQVEQLAELVAAEMADTAVNMGVERAATFLQRSLNVLNNRQKHYADILVDGDVGNRTLEALGSYIAMRGDEGITILHRMLNALQGSFYIELAERREKDEKHLYGWFKHRVS